MTAMSARDRWERWYAANREHYNAYQRAYWKKRRNFQLLTPEEARSRKLSRMAAWRAAKPDLVQAGHAAVNANRRARRWGVVGTVQATDILSLWLIQPNCLGCGEGRGVDHVLAMREGGPNSLSNLQNLCMNCNSTKENERRRHEAASPK